MIASFYEIINDENYRSGLRNNRNHTRYLQAAGSSATGDLAFTEEMLRTAHRIKIKSARKILTSPIFRLV